MKKHLIIGGLGFIGHNIAKQLLNDQNNYVIIYDAYKHFLPFNTSDWKDKITRRIREIKHKNLEIIKGDCLDSKLLKKTILEHQPETVFHLAALPIPGIANNNPFKAKLNIYDSTFTLLDILKTIKSNRPRLIFASSSMVYGHFKRNNMDEVIPATENQMCEPIGIYGVMKLNSENLIKTYSLAFDVQYTIIRPSAVYGPTDCNMRVSEIFIKNALQAEPIVIDNGGLHKLDFTYVTDTAKGFVLAANNEKAIGETFNISAGNGRQVIELAKIISNKVTGTRIEDRPIYPYRPNRGSLNINKAKLMLGFSPEYSLENGIALYLNYIKNKEYPNV